MDRYERLCVALKEANDWLKAGEGVDLFYYLRHAGRSARDDAEVLAAALDINFSDLDWPESD